MLLYDEFSDCYRAEVGDQPMKNSNWTKLNLFKPRIFTMHFSNKSIQISVRKSIDKNLLL